MKEVPMPNNYLPFSIEEWKKRPADLITRGGYPVIISGYNENAKAHQKLVGWVDNKICSWSEEGRFDTEEAACDLFMLPEAKVFYHNYWDDGHQGIPHSTLEAALEAGSARNANKLVVHRFTIRGKEVTAEIVHTY